MVPRKGGHRQEGTFSASFLIMKTTAYRFPREHFILWTTVLVIGALALLTAGATICLLPLLLAGVMAYAYQANQ